MPPAVAQGVPHFGALIVFVNRPHRADRRALTAVDAGASGKGLFVGRCYAVMDTAAGCVDCPDGLNLLAGFHAAPAFNAFAHVPHQGSAAGFARWRRGGFAAEGRGADAKAGGKGLQVALFIADTVQAVLGMICQKQLHDHFAGADDTGVIRNYPHPFFNGVGAGGF